MAQTVADIMSKAPVTLPSTASLQMAAVCMKERDIGDVVVTDGGEVCGVVTDRDIVIRAVADGRDVGRTMLDDICTHEVISLSPNDTVDHAVELMRERAVRRLPVIEDGKPVGMVSIGDLAMDRDPHSALADISGAPPNR